MQPVPARTLPSCPPPRPTTLPSSPLPPPTLCSPHSTYIGLCFLKHGRSVLTSGPPHVLFSLLEPTSPDLSMAGSFQSFRPQFQCYLFQEVPFPLNNTLYCCAHGCITLSTSCLLAYCHLPHQEMAPRVCIQPRVANVNAPLWPQIWIHRSLAV